MRTCVKFRKIKLFCAYTQKQTLEIWKQGKSFFMRNLEHWISI